jgi:predicted amidohydrolase YtcJ
LGLAQIQLAEVATLSALEPAVRAFALANPNLPWLLGQGLRYDLPGPGQPLTRHHLDALAPDQPMLLYAYDHHTAWANTRALALGGILRSGEPTGPNSEIVRGPDGLATGELRESGAYAPLRALLPPPTEVETRTWLRAGLAQAARLGLTSVHNMDGNAEHMALYAALEDLGQLTLGVYVPSDVKPDTPLEALAQAAELRVRAGSVKFFMDGVVEGFTALLLSPYPERPASLGDANFNAEHFNRMACEADRLGLQILVHAIGDGAVRRTLDGFEAAQHANGPRDSRHRVEHIELLHPADLPRFADLGVIASMQPYHAPLSGHSGDAWLTRAGPAKWPFAFPWRQLRQAGARLVFGSDWPVVTQDPLRGLHAALTRLPYAVGLTDQRQSLAEALCAYTRDAAHAEFQEGVKGQLLPGLLADLVVLSHDLFSLPPDDLPRVHPVLTLCDGEITFQA